MLTIDRLHLASGARTLVRSLDAQLCAGALWCVAGPNGAGKTTLLRTLAGLAAPAGGQLALHGRPLREWPLEALARERALLTQSLVDPFGVSVFESVLLGRHPYLGRWGWERPEDRLAAMAALEELGLAELATRPISALSGGERQRVALAALLAQDAPLMLLDEPLAHLDLRHQLECLRLLRARASDGGNGGALVILSCHDLNLARAFASHALLLDGRGGVELGPVRDVLTPAKVSHAFDCPVRLVGEGVHAMLTPLTFADESQIMEPARAACARRQSVAEPPAPRPTR